MNTYRVKPRTFAFADGQQPPLPAQAKIVFHFVPGQPFGVENGGGRTATAGTITIHFDPDTGQSSWESARPLSPLNVILSDDLYEFRLSGCSLEITQTVETLAELSGLLETVYFALPILLNAEFADPPLVTRVNGTVGDVNFQWILMRFPIDVIVTTQELQESHVANAWNRMKLLSDPSRRRLLAALHYFHVACRLNRVSACPGEFLAESLINFAKILEVLFAGSLNAARVELKKLGLTEEDIERDFAPACYLRSQIDVAHVSLSLFEREELQVLQLYADRAENAFRKLMQRVLKKLDDRTLELPEHELHGSDANIQRTIGLLRERLAQLPKSPNP